MSALTIFFIALVSLFAAATAFLTAFFFFRQPDKNTETNNTARKTKINTAILFAAAAFTLVFVALFSIYLYTFQSAANKATKEITTTIMYIIVPSALLATILLTVAIKTAKPNTKKEFFTTKNLTRMAVFTALSLVLYLVAKFPLPFIFPEFLDIQISDMPALLAGFTMGGGAGSIIVILKTLIKLPMTGTGGVGELADLILGLIYVLSSSFIYSRLKSKAGAVTALAISSVLVTAAAILINRFILIPFYTAYLLPWEALLGMVRPLYPNITKASFYRFYLWLAVLPFNALRCLIVSLVTFFLYKPVKRIFRQKPDAKSNSPRQTT